MAATGENNAKPSVDFVFKDWLELLQKFYNDVEQTLETVRQDKREIQEIKKEIYNRVNKGQYMYDKDRIVISAPEIIIGNVDKSGQLKPGASKVIIRSNDISLEGVGETGKVQTKATTIQQLAVDPGDDGLEAVVYDNACIASQARAIVLDSNNAVGTYTRGPQDKVITAGINIHSDLNLSIDSSLSRSELTEGIDKKVSLLEGDIDALKTNSAALLKTMKEQIGLMEEVLLTDKKLCKSDELTKANVTVLDMLHLRLTDRSIAYFNTINEFLASTSEMAEKIRQKKALEEAKLTVSAADFEKQAIGTNLKLNAESIFLQNFDGDYNQRTNPDAKIDLKSQNINIQSVDKLSGNLKDGRITMWGENVDIYTNIVKQGEKEGDLDMPASGTFTVNSNSIRLMSYDLKGTQGGPVEFNNLAESGIVQVMSGNIDIRSVDQNGNAVGMTSIVGKNINIRSVNFSPDTWEEQKAVPEGRINLMAEKIRLGERKTGTKHVTLSSDSVYALGNSKVLVRLVSDKKKYIRLSKDHIRLKAPSITLFGDNFKVHSNSKFSNAVEMIEQVTTNKIKVKEELDAPNTKASAAFKSPPSQDSAKENTDENNKSSEDDKEMNNIENEKKDELENKFTKVVKSLFGMKLRNKRV